MALRKKVHTLTFYPITETPNATTKVVPVPSEGAGVAVQGQLTPMSAESAFKATGLELNNPHLFLCDVEDAGSIPFNAKAIDSAGVIYAVRTKPKKWNAITANSCAETVLEQVEFRA